MYHPLSKEGKQIQFLMAVKGKSVKYEERIRQTIK